MDVEKPSQLADKIAAAKERREKIQKERDAARSGFFPQRDPTDLTRSMTRWSYEFYFPRLNLKLIIFISLHKPFSSHFQNKLKKF